MQHQLLGKNCILIEVKPCCEKPDEISLYVSIPKLDDRK
jgi:hypothetical protein